ncbi:MULTISPECIES: bifunctional (p)ppGpp synthetase/guanosine-3',5'-bis(diphosphate) 3'-pyrophosphohydrolase [unclassified Rudaea]|uniref:RelA/SpoT family protein n=1 Tax=unclassified Rudaea TaxID=2627037 RepID=UPI0020162B26|nr:MULTISPECIES: bifunctional (p)ppGpp synthetase/guanosine-3',5'-bis(diphosphate) 3'-pyrophosphohydrolase [unclassified Rudaea]
MKSVTQKSGSLAAWLARAAADGGTDEALSLISALAAQPEAEAAIAGAEAEMLVTLQLLESLDLDRETLVAYVLHSLQQSGAAADAARLAKLPASLRDLLEGQQAAEKVGALHKARSGGGNAEGLRRLLLAIIKDLRVVFILLARQLARLRAADKLEPEQRRELAQLTADIHAPLANRLGIWQLKWELEDLAFRYLQPDTYRRIVRLLDERRSERDSFIETTIRTLRHALKDAGIKADIAGRSKHIYSIWKKMQRKGGDFSALYDIRAVRLLVDDVASCYAALGIVHTLWPPVPSEFDDYIARPKGNNYQSLHTAVVGPQGKTLEVQIRTHDMHAFAERGVAAHWRYKEATAAAVSSSLTPPSAAQTVPPSPASRARDESRRPGAAGFPIGGGADESFERKVAWMRSLLEAKDEPGDEAALLDGFKTDLLEDRAYLLTPAGEVVDLPRGATVLDFAYTVHTDVGHRTRGAKVNGRIVPLTFQPASGDRVEILTGKAAEPRRDWMNAQSGFLTTQRARAKVRAWFKRIDHGVNLAAGREILEREFKRLALHNVELDSLPARFHFKTLDEFLIALALGDITAGHVARMLHEAQAPAPAPVVAPAPVRAPKRDKDAIVIEGVGNLLTTMARCCQPLPGDAIAGYITQGRGVSIHRADCASFARLRARDPSRAIEVEWGGARKADYDVDLVVRGYDRKGLHKDVTNVIAGANISLIAVNARVDATTGLVTMNFSVRVADFEQLSSLLGRLIGVPNVIEARRVA